MCCNFSRYVLFTDNVTSIIYKLNTITGLFWLTQQYNILQISSYQIFLTCLIEDVTHALTREKDLRLTTKPRKGDMS